MSAAGGDRPAGPTDRLASIELDDAGLPPPSDEIEQERRVAIFDLLEENTFRLVPREGRPTPAGPYGLRLAVRDRRLVFTITASDGGLAGEIHLALSPFRNAVRDYFAIIQQYFDAIRRLPAHQIETIDMGRRGVHDEGSRILLERLEGKVEIDFTTARRFFTLICVLHYGE